MLRKTKEKLYPKVLDNYRGSRDRIYVLSPILIAVVIDAWVVRRLKYESFAVHHPTLYQAALSSPTVLLICAFAVMLMPWFIPTWIAALFYVAFLMSIHLIVSNFHRFG